MSHGVAQIHILHTPAVAFKLMHDYPMKVLIVHGIVRAKSGGITATKPFNVLLACTRPLVTEFADNQN